MAGSVLFIALFSFLGYQTINYNARSILPWEVNIEPKALFKNDVIHCNVPNTDRIRVSFTRLKNFKF